MGKEWFKLSRRLTIVLFGYYVLVLLCGLVISLLSLLHDQTFIQPYPIFNKALIASTGMALLGCSVFYIRKLYKACINADMSSPENESDRMKQVGVTMYFLLRPVFSIIFSILILTGIKASIFGVTVNNTELDNGFIYYSMFFSFFAGFSAGDLLDILEQTGKEIFQRLFERAKV